MSNLIKSGFVAFSRDDKLVIDANENKIIKAIDADAEERKNDELVSVEEALAEALILDAELDGADFVTSRMDGQSDVISQDEAQQVADDMIQAARAEAENIVSKAHDEAEQLRAASYDEAENIKLQAQEEGYQIGYNNAVENLSKEFAEKEANLERKLQEYEEEFREREIHLVEETEQRMVELLCQLIPSITGVVIEGQQDVLLYMINAAMHDLDNSKHFVVKVSSNDYDQLVERKEEIYGALNPAIELEIFEDTKLDSMQCIIETDNGLVDISLDVQLDNLIKALKLMIKE